METAGSERLRIDSAGRIGIGEVSPGSYSSGAYNLVISSPSGSNSGISINSASGGTDSGAIFFSHGTASGANGVGRIRYYHSDDHMDFLTANAERLRITSDGKIGINCTPLSQFQVGGGTSPHTNKATVHIAPSSGNASLCLRGGNPTIFFDKTGSPANAKILLDNVPLAIHSGTIDSEGSELLRITSTGRLLMGTTTEGYASADDLTVATTGNTGITIRSGTGNLGTIAFSDGTSGDAEYRGYFQYEHNGDFLKIGTAGAEKVRITSGGRLGLGLASPQAMMHIEGGSLGNLLQLSNTHTGATTSDGFVMGINSSLTYLYNRENKHLTFGTANGERLRITSDGKLLVGATAATSGGIAEFHRQVDGGAQGCHILIKNTSTNSVNNTARLKLETSGGTAEFFAFAAAETYLRSRTGGAANLLLLADGASKIRMFTNGNDRLQITSNGTVLHGSGAIATQKASNGGFDTVSYTHLTLPTKA